MKRFTFLGLLTIWFVTPAVGAAQTLPIQAYLEHSLYEQRYCASCHQLAAGGKDKAGDPKPGSLDHLIAEALKNNPDIRVAESKIRDAQAELNRTRMKVVSDVTYLHAEIQAAQALVDYAKKQFDRVSQLKATNAISATEYDQAATALEKAKTELSLKKAKLPYLTGQRFTVSVLQNDIDAVILNQWLNVSKEKPGTTDVEFLRRFMLDVLGRLPTVEETRRFEAMPEKDRRRQWIEHVLPREGGDSGVIRGFPYFLDEIGPNHRWWQHLHAYPRQPQLPASMTDKLRAALDKTVPGFAYGNTPIKEVLDYVRDRILPDINVTVRAKVIGKNLVSVELKQPIPAGAALQYLEDELGIVFVLRDYGIVVVPADERLPPGAMRVGDFWKQGKTKAPASGKEPVDPKKAKFPNPPPKEIKGVIEKIDAQDRSLVRLSVGSDDGLEAGHTVDVYRLDPQPKFLGTLRIVNVTARTAVGQVVGGGGAPSLRVGDLVARQLTPDDATRRE